MTRHYPLNMNTLVPVTRIPQAACGWVCIQAYLTAVDTLLPSAHLRAVCSGPACCSLSSKFLLYYDERGQEKRKEKNEEEEGGRENNDIL